MSGIKELNQLNPATQVTLPDRQNFQAGDCSVTLPAKTVLEFSGVKQEKNRSNFYYEVVSLGMLSEMDDAGCVWGVQERTADEPGTQVVRQDWFDSRND